MPVVLILVFSAHVFTHSKTVHAADNNFSNGITVDSTLDGADANVGDGVCDDGDGNCTLRAAIQEANSNADYSVINFGISGVADFTVGGQNGYTIKPLSALPAVTQPVTINGYTQPGSLANTATAPNPLNGRLLIELKGSLAGGADAFRFTNAGDNSTVKGLVINDFGSGDAFVVLADSLAVQGNYIGTDPTGSVAHPNRVAVTAETLNLESGHDALIGGLSPADRNLISGNTDNSDNLGAATAGYPGTGWVIQGNYVGLAANGLSALPNGIVGGSGAFSIDDCQDVLIGGDQPGAINVVGTNFGHGVAPGMATGVSIIGNYIGLGYDGATVIDNGIPGLYGAGITVHASSDVIINNNRVAGWSGQGIYLASDNTDFTILGNEVYGNESGGIYVAGTQVSIENNAIYDNAQYNVQIGSYSPVDNATSDISFRANKVGIKSDDSAGTNNDAGVIIFGDPTDVYIGGTGANDGNQIAHNKKGGIIVSSFFVQPAELALNIQKVSILGNSIYANEPAVSGPFALGGLGIDLLTDVDLDGDFSVDTQEDVGSTLNDAADSDTGANNYINFPVLNSVVQTGTQATINFNLDAADSPANQYRVEFFANDQADPSGYGEGQTFLGATTTVNGNDLTATLTLPSGLDLAGKSISATTTALDDSTSSGFGATSEFSQIVTVSVQGVGENNGDSSNNGQSGVADNVLAGTGQNMLVLIGVASLLLLSAGAVVSRRSR